MTRNMILAVVTIASLCAAESSALAQTIQGPPVTYDGAQEIYDNAVDLLQSTVSRCRRHNRETTVEAVRVINFLVNIGQDELAVVAAEHFAEEIVDFSAKCENYATTQCRRAIEKLRQMGATELARALREHCLRALDLIDDSTEYSLQQIRAALP